MFSDNNPTQQKGPIMHRDVPVADYVSALGLDGQLIDVREPAEVAQGTLPGAVNIPLQTLPARIGELDPERPVVLLCRSGGRSSQAAQFLTRSGFENVVNLAGGISALQPV